jgi:hypothetical protein
VIEDTRSIVPPPDFGSGPGVRARVREYRLGLLRQVLDRAEGPLRYEDAFALLPAIDGVGIPLRTLKEPPFADLISAQTPRRGRMGALSGLPWLLRRLPPDRLAERRRDVEARLRAMRIDWPVHVDSAGDADAEAGRIRRVWDMERAIAAEAEEHGRAVAASMKARLVERRGEVMARREAALSLAYHELRRTVRSGRSD